MNRKNIINVNSIMGILIMVVLICLFFSKSFYSKNLPEVTAVLPYEGYLSNSNDTGKKNTIIPKRAIYPIDDGSFVFQIKKRKGILGEEYYLYQLRIQTGDADKENTVLLSTMEYLEPIVLSSNKELEDGMIVRVKNETDFFVDY